MSKSNIMIYFVQGGLSYRRSEIRSCIGQGVQKGRRGEIWSLIVAQSGEKTPVPTGQWFLRYQIFRQFCFYLINRNLNF